MSLDDCKSMNQRHLRAAHRWLEIAAGAVLAFWTLLAAAGAAAMLIPPPSRERLLVLAAGALLLFWSGWCLDKTARLITGHRSAHIGLLSPLALRAISVVFLLLPFGSLILGYYSDHRLPAVVQAVTCFIICAALLRQARRSTRGPAIAKVTVPCERET